MTLYLDASVIVALFVTDAHSSRADTLLRRESGVLVVSDFAAAEWSSALSRRVRGGELTRADASAAVANFDQWTARAAQRLEIAASDVAVAIGWLRQFDRQLRTPDAINIAMAARVSATLATFDAAMASNARTLGVPVAD